MRNSNDTNCMFHHSIYCCEFQLLLCASVALYFGTFVPNFRTKKYRTKRYEMVSVSLHRANEFVWLHAQLLIDSNVKFRFRRSPFSPTKFRDMSHAISVLICWFRTVSCFYLICSNTQFIWVQFLFDHMLRNRRAFMQMRCVRS